jgi:superfamily II DNA or RNA helicase
VSALGFAIAYLVGDKKLPTEGFENEAALVKMATGTGKSAVITMLSRCLPDVQRVLILTPREALTDQLYRYIRHDFWETMGFQASARSVFADDGTGTGAPVPMAHIAKLLPSAVRALLHASETEERIVLVGTLQAVNQIRRKATRPVRSPDEQEAADLAQQMLDLIGSFDMVIVDEGHYEPAVSWSRAIREADRPTILFSATPYRNDYKSFRVRGRFIFNQPIQASLNAQVIRSPAFVELPVTLHDGTVNLALDRRSWRRRGRRVSPNQRIKAAPVASRQESKARSRATRYSLAERR